MELPERPNQPPHNPGLRDLIQGKRQYAHPQTREEGILGFRGWHERGFLPHFDKPGLTQFVTFRLADSLPVNLQGEWEALLQVEDDAERRRQLEAYLDLGRGRCELQGPEVATLVENALRFFHGQRYDLHGWVIMPNHVHVLFHVGEVPMSEIIESWKSFTAKEANKLLGRTGQFWAADYFDTYMRNEDQERRVVRYIEENPAKARLVRLASDWRWSSRRLRDEQGRLNLER